MKVFINNTISVSYSLVRFKIIGLFSRGRFKSHFIERFSPNTQISLVGNGQIKLGRAVRAHSNVKIKSIKNGVIEIGQNTSFNYNCMITAMKYIKIGEGVEFGPNVLIYDHDHDFKVKGGIKANKYIMQDVIIGDNCWIGANTVILRGSTIGSNSVIGAGSIIKGCFPNDSLIIQRKENIVNKIISITS
uniref:acyltransferase n=1 Tax=Flavobacterium sp. TaxID=239 RepID=UPI00404AE598